MNVSHHLGIQKDCGLVAAERDGRFVRYALAGAAVGGGTLTLAHASGAKVVIPLG